VVVTDVAFAHSGDLYGQNVLAHQNLSKCSTSQTSNVALQCLIVGLKGMGNSHESATGEADPRY